MAAASKAEISTGLLIDGWTGIPTTSSGVTVSGGVYSLAGSNQIDYIRIPYLGTPDISSTDYVTEITIDFQVNAISNGSGSPNMVLASRYKQGSTNDPASWLIFIDSATRTIRFSYNNLGVVSSGVIAYGTRHILKLTRLGGVYYMYLDDSLILTTNYPGNRYATWDWVLGSYLTQTNQVITASFAAWANWQLFSFRAKRVT